MRTTNLLSLKVVSVSFGLWSDLPIEPLTDDTIIAEINEWGYLEPVPPLSAGNCEVLRKKDRFGFPVRRQQHRCKQHNILVIWDD